MLSGFSYELPLLLCITDAQFLCFPEYGLILVPHKMKMSNREDDDDKKHDHASCCCPVVQVASAESLVVDEEARSERCTVRSSPQEEAWDIEHLQATDHAGDQAIEQDGLESGQGDLQEDLRGGGPINLGSLEEGGIDAKHPGNENNHGVAMPHPELDESDNTPSRPLLHVE